MNKFSHTTNPKGDDTINKLYTYDKLYKICKAFNRLYELVFLILKELEMSSSHSDDEHALRLDAASSTIANLMAEIFDDSGYLPSEIMDVMKSAGKSSRDDMHKTISDIIYIIKHPN